MSDTSHKKDCPECTGRGPGYCPVCKQRRRASCEDCGKTLSDEERNQRICELCSMYPSSKGDVK
jgi:hypothetical protein